VEVLDVGVVYRTKGAGDEAIHLTLDSICALTTTSNWSPTFYNVPTDPESNIFETYHKLVSIGGLRIKADTKDGVAGILDELNIGEC